MKAHMEIYRLRKHSSWFNMVYEIDVFINNKREDYGFANTMWGSRRVAKNMVKKYQNERNSKYPRLVKDYYLLH